MSNLFEVRKNTFHPFSTHATRCSLVSHKGRTGEQHIGEPSTLANNTARACFDSVGAFALGERDMAVWDNVAVESTGKESGFPAQLFGVEES